jgi:small subunit ribosomal protein S9
MAAKTKNKKYIFAVGRRKRSTARVRLFRQSRKRQKSLVNGLPVEKYFTSKVFARFWQLPFQLTDTLDKYYVTVKVVGGGKKGQLDAVVHAIAKALNKADRDKFRSALKKVGLLTRDARIKERRKVGTGGKARKQKQSPKR